MWSNSCSKMIPNLMTRATGLQNRGPLWMLQNWSLMIKGSLLEPSYVPYSPNQFLEKDFFFCSYLQQTGPSLQVYLINTRVFLLVKNLFLSLPWKLVNPYCHIVGILFTSPEFQAILWPLLRVISENYVTDPDDNELHEPWRSK